MLDTDSALDSSFTDGLIFTGASSHEIEFQKETLQALRQRDRWTMFPSQQESRRDIAQGPYLYHDGAIWQVLRIHDDTVGSFMTAIAPPDLTQIG